MEVGIMIDTTKGKECAVPKEKYRINKYTFVKDCPFFDLVGRDVPYFHFQILKPESIEKRTETIAYLKKHLKLYVTFNDRQDILLFLGCTTDVYIKSSLVEVDENTLRNSLSEVGHWYRYYGNDYKL